MNHQVKWLTVVLLAIEILLALVIAYFIHAGYPIQRVSALIDAAFIVFLALCAFLSQSGDDTKR